MEAEEDEAKHENEDENNSGRVSGGGRGWQVREILGIGAVALAMFLLPEHFHSTVKDREQREGKKYGGSVRTDGESSDGWLVDGWTALNDTISQ